MELKNPYAIYIGIPVILILTLISFGARKKYIDGRKVANTEVIEGMKYYKQRMMEYRICSVTMIISLAVALSFLMMLIARPFRARQKVTEIHNRDIYVCLDTSYSAFQIDLETVRELKDFVNGLQGERFGITIFNCKTVQLVPLTNDYEYIIEVLDKLEESCLLATKYVDVYTGFARFPSVEKERQFMYMIDGTVKDPDPEYHGSSIAGEGLVTTLFEFPELKEDETRTRVIILCTDNQVENIQSEDSYVHLEEAMALCKKYNVIVFGVTPKQDEVRDFDMFEDGCKTSGGDIFTLDMSNMAERLVEAVEKTDTYTIYKSDIIETEYPEAIVACATIALVVYYVLGKRIKL
ncbi:MAG: hypothetical protein KBT07_00290 [Clostridiales bacterium]|nr:hypothetical protein [Candidatus Scatonaster coprocaballi]